MTPDDRPHFVATLGLLAELYQFELTDPALELYFRALEDLTVAQFDAAILRVSQACKFFPRPVEIRACAGVVEAPTLTAADMEFRLVRILRRATVRMPTDLDPFDAFVIRCLGGEQAVLEMPADKRRFLLSRHLADWITAAQARDIPVPRLLPAREILGPRAVAALEHPRVKLLTGTTA